MSKNKVLALLLAIAYFLALVYFHEAATDAADWLKYKLTLKYYNLTFFLSGLAISLAASLILLKKVLKYPARRPFLVFFVISVLLMIAAVRTMTVVDMEAIHFIQYGILAVLILPLTRRYESAFVYSTILGIIDEVYQYIVLNPDFSYFDFNDIVLNMLGAGAGLLITAVIALPPIDIRPWRWHSSPAFWFLAAIIVISIMFSLQISVTFYPQATGEETGSWFSLYRQSLPDKFWTFLYDKRYYHILSPWEAILVISFLTIFYSATDNLYRRAKRIEY